MMYRIVYTKLSYSLLTHIGIHWMYYLYRPYGFDVTTSCNQREMNSGQKSGYFGAILSGQNDGSEWSVSTGEQFVSSFLTSARNNFTFLPRMHKVSTGSNAH